MSIYIGLSISAAGVENFRVGFSKGDVRRRYLSFVFRPEADAEVPWNTKYFIELNVLEAHLMSHWFH